MPIEQKLFRCEEDDPNRCQSGGAHGQCPYKASEGSQYCERHGANKARQAADEKALRTYRLGQWDRRKNELADDGKIKSLREEIGIARIMCETIMQSCTNDNELIVNSAKISDLLMKIEKLVSTCNTLEMKMGMLLDRSAIMQIGAVIVDLAADFVTDPDQREQFATKIVEAIVNTQIKKE